MNESHGNPLIVEVGECDFDSQVLRSKQPVLIAFWAPWSRPCHVLEAALEEVAAACAARVKVARVNADDAPELSLVYEVQSVPTLLYFVDGTLQFRLVGTASKAAILAKLERAGPGARAQSLDSPHRSPQECPESP